MKNLFKSALLAIGFATILFVSGCKKKEVEQPEDTSSQQETAKDENNISSESDNAINDANAAISGEKSINGRIDGVCGGTAIADSINKTITITYNGVACSGTIRNGVLKLSLISGSRWKDMGATVKIEFINLKVTKPDGKSYTLNGTSYNKNISGGIVWVDQNVMHHSKGQLTIDFGTKTAVWNHSRMVTFITDGVKHTMSVYGDTTANGFNNVAMWGTTRNGESFTARVSSTEALTANNICGWHRPVSGTRSLTIGSREITVKLGMKADKTPANGDCLSNAGFVLSWKTANGAYGDAFVPYK